ncbi:MAG: antA/AntB antirepressor family protein [Magnetococcales bacterium]|nr:antA/AntB antirepressor family protein [Magnetococcales bacterium]
MQQPAIPGEIGGASILTVNARELHKHLGVGKDFSNWIKDRVAQYDFVENQDFVVYANSGENPSGGRPAKDYHITIDMAKELCMVDRSDKGKGGVWIGPPLPPLAGRQSDLPPS